MNSEASAASERTAIGRAYSKLILIGEHAVVHGQPAIAIPFPMIGVEVVVQSVLGSIQLNSELYQGPLESAPPALNGVKKCIEATLKYLQLPEKDLYMDIQSSIPTGKGLGSSASVAIAIVRSLFAYVERSYLPEELLDLANVSEAVAHGSPSGIDTVAVTATSPIWFERSGHIVEIEPQSDFHFVVADTGRANDTRTAVQSVADLFMKAPKQIQRSFNRLGELTYQARKVLEKTGKQVLGQILNEAQKELEALGVSDVSLNRLIYLARQEGALGAKLTGAGNGGCMIALARDATHSQHLSESLLRSGAEAVWSFVLGKQSENENQ